MLEVANVERISDALRVIPADDRDTWVRMGMAIKSELGEDGFDLWDEWSRQAESYSRHDARAVWNSIRPDGKVTIGSMFHEAKQRGWTAHGERPASPFQDGQTQGEDRAELQDRDEAEHARKRAHAAAKAMELWRTAKSARGDHPYLVRKGVTAVPSLKEIGAEAAASILGYHPSSSGERLTGRILVAPVKVGDRISTAELIDEAGRKSAIAGGAKAGGYWAAQPLPEVDGGDLRILIGEGVATVLSAREATGHAAIAALSAQNLRSVARALRARYPAATLVILADLVKTTGEPDAHAVAAARESGGLLAVPDFGPGRLEGDTDFNDMVRQRGTELVRAVIDAAMAPPAPAIEAHPRDAASANAGMQEWPEPQPLTLQVQPEPYPIDALPPGIRAAVQEVQGFTKAPIPLVVSSALAVLSAAAQAQFDVERAETLKGPISLFMLTVADSGERKSTCDNYFALAIREFEREQAEAMAPELKRHTAELDAWKAEREAVLASIKGAARDPAKGKQLDTLRQGLVELEQRKPVPPRVPQLLLGDETPENLAWSLASKWPSAAMLVSEAALILGSHGMGSESIMRNLGLLDVLWDGGSHSVGRRTSESFTVRGARLTVGLQVQEATIRHFLEQSKGLARGTGFLARLLFAWPESTQGTRFFTKAPPAWPALSAFHRRISALLALPTPIDDSGALTPALLTLTREANDAWTAFHDEIEAELGAGGELHDVRDVASKTADQAVRLAALFHAFTEGAGGAIAPETFSGASRIAAWHLNEARRFLGELALPPELSQAAELDRWLVNYCRQNQTARVSTTRILQKGPARLRKSDVIKRVIPELAELGRVRMLMEGRQKFAEVNPALLLARSTE